MARRTSTTEIEVYPEADRSRWLPAPACKQPRLFGHLSRHSRIWFRRSSQVACTMAGSSPEPTVSAKPPWPTSLPCTLCHRAVERSAGRNSRPVSNGDEASPPRCARSDGSRIPACSSFAVATTSRTSGSLTRFRLTKSDDCADFSVTRLQMMPGGVVIVDRADELNINAANALLLKSLEEPPQRTVFLLLIAIEPGRLLPTIRSRCRLLALEPSQRQGCVGRRRTSSSITSELESARLSFRLTCANGCGQCSASAGIVDRRRRRHLKGDRQVPRVRFRAMTGK